MASAFITACAVSTIAEAMATALFSPNREESAACTLSISLHSFGVMCDADLTDASAKVKTMFNTVSNMKGSSLL